MKIRRIKKNLKFIKNSQPHHITKNAKKLRRTLTKTYQKLPKTIEK